MKIRESSKVNAFVDSARAYCDAFSRNPEDPKEWAEEILRSLSILYAAAIELPDCGLSDDAIDVPDSFDIPHDAWSEMFGRVSGILGEREEYWAYFDPVCPENENEEPIFHSLADDLCDVYRDIEPGLRAWNSGKDEYLESIVFDWKVPLFGTHWGLHAVSAMRALHYIVYLHGIAKGAEQNSGGNA